MNENRRRHRQWTTPKGKRAWVFALALSCFICEMKKLKQKIFMIDAYSVISIHNTILLDQS